MYKVLLCYNQKEFVQKYFFSFNMFKLINSVYKMLGELVIVICVKKVLVEVNIIIFYVSCGLCYSPVDLFVSILIVMSYGFVIIYKVLYFEVPIIPQGKLSCVYV